MNGAGTLCLFAKPPRAGEVKTRLIPALGADGAAQLARAMLLDAWATLGKIANAHRIIASTDLELGVCELNNAEVWLQGEGDLGARMERILRRGLSGSRWAMALGSDTPGLPVRVIEDARRALEANHAVLGPAADGGFYLLGLTTCPPGLLADLPWSTAQTLAQTEARLRQRGLRVAKLEPGFDVDEPGDLDTLERALREGPITAPETARTLRGLRDARP